MKVFKRLMSYPLLLCLTILLTVQLRSEYEELPQSTNTAEFDNDNFAEGLKLIGQLGDDSHEVRKNASKSLIDLIKRYTLNDSFDPSQELSAGLKKIIGLIKFASIYGRVPESSEYDLLKNGLEIQEPVIQTTDERIDAPQDNSSDAEIMIRARELISRIEYYVIVPGEILQGDQKIVERILEQDTKIFPAIRGKLIKLDKKIVPLMRKFLFSSCGFYRAEAVDALTTLNANELIGEIFPLLQDECMTVSLYVANALYKLGDKKLIEEILPFLKSPNPVTRFVSVVALTSFKEKSVLEHITPLLKDGEALVCTSAVDAVAQLGNVLELIPLFKESDVVVRSRIASALLNSREKSIPKELVSLFKECKNELQVEIAILIASKKDKGIRQDIVPLLTSTHVNTRRLAVYILSSLGEKDDIANLLLRLNDNDSFVRIETIICLKKFNYSTYAKDLIPLLKDIDKHVREEAKESIIESFIRQMTEDEALLQIKEEVMNEIKLLLNDNDSNVRKLAQEILNRTKKN
jgi:HEAT repeat protein